MVKKQLEEWVSEQKDFQRGVEPKLLYLDLEISPMLVFTFSAYEANAISIKMHPQIISFSWSWNDEKKIYVRALPDYRGYKKGVNKLDDRNLVHELHDVMEEADVVIGHNIKKFDVKHAKARFIYHGLPVSKKWVLEDTLFMAKKYFKFPKNNLDQLAEHFGVGTKAKVRYIDSIWGCLDGDIKSWRDMAFYNVQDVRITREVYKKLAPWHETHFNLNYFRRVDGVCPHCTSKRMKHDGYRYNATSIKQRWKCGECGKNWTGAIVDKDFERVKQSNS